MDNQVYRPMKLDRTDSSLQKEISEACRVDIEMCLECGKCSGGCSNTHIMDFTPRKIIQLIKLGKKEILLRSEALWVCVGCQLCLDRCPSGIDIPRIVDYLREQSYDRGIKPARENVALFNELMLASVYKAGRVSEALLILKFNLRSKQYFKDAGLGGRMFLKGKLNPLVPKVKGAASLRGLFKSRPTRGEG